MTHFIREEALLDSREIDRIIADTPAELIAFVDRAARVPLAERPTMGHWLERFNAGAASFPQPERDPSDPYAPV